MTVLRRSSKGFTLIETLTVLAISSMLLVLLAVLFKTGLWQVSRSSGRIEVVRNGRQALDNIQRYLASAMPPVNLRDVDDKTLSPDRAIFAPDSDEIHDPDNGVSIDWQQRIQFFSQVDLLGGTPPLGARDITLTPPNLAFEITTVPSNSGEGQDIVLRQLSQPTPWDDAALPLLTDNTVTPRLIGRRLGVPGNPGFRDGLLIRRLTGGSLLVNVNVWAALVSDDHIKGQIENVEGASDGNYRIITMSTIFQPPYFNLR